VSGSFRWPDPDDNRGVIDVLIAEGVDFVEGNASLKQQISSEELASIVDDEAPEEIAE
jgi:hypothetical protein